ncbi:SUMF1/EgtB/PvdO family nonheme iron enzyme [Colwellia sp. MEBiC06753]
MRLAFIALSISSIVLGATSQANESIQVSPVTVTSLQQQYVEKEQAYAQIFEQIEQLTKSIETQELALQALRAKGDDLEAAREKALFEMNMQYEALVDDPEEDIAAAQNAYRQAVIDQKNNKIAIKEKVNVIADLKEQKVQADVLLISTANQKEALAEEIKFLRVARLREEFEQVDTKTVSQNVDCDTNETFKSCVTRGNLLGKQKASKLFLNDLFASVTESKLVEKNAVNSAARVKLLNHKVISGNFSGSGQYSTDLVVEMRGSLPSEEACKLLELPARYCQVDLSEENAINALVGQLTGASQADNQSLSDDDSVMYELTVRSNQYDDEVFIDGVSYGSTKLSVMLSSGTHDILITKPGYEDYQEKFKLDKNKVIKAELNRSAGNLASGEKIQDLLMGDKYGPTLVGVPAGSFQMGDTSGQGLNNERPARTENIQTGFAVSESPVTVGDFKLFIQKTGYVTSAETGDGCATLVDGKPVYDVALNWRNPGFNQTDQHPLVCVNKADIEKYFAWISGITRKTYRLPTEVEWEYVARAGSDNDFWWGNDVGNDNANCAYCGSNWSNVSTSPVQSFKANKFGLYDTVGNVWELTSGDDVVARGGAWNFAPKLSRTTVRLSLPESFRSNYLGFRVVRDN